MPQAVNYSTPPGRVTVVSESSSTANSYLMIRGARVDDSGIYTCSPSNAKVASVKVHVLKGGRKTPANSGVCQCDGSAVYPSQSDVSAVFLCKCDGSAVSPCQYIVSAVSPCQCGAGCFLKTVS